MCDERALFASAKLVAALYDVEVPDGTDPA
jgi:hypothetical protein